MHHVSRILGTILLNILLLTANGGWLLSQFQMTILITRFTGNETVRIDRDGWLIQSTICNRRNPSNDAMFEARAVPYDELNKAALRWDQALSDEPVWDELPGVVWFQPDSSGRILRQLRWLLGLRHWLVLAVIWALWFCWNRRAIRSHVSRHTEKRPATVAEV